MLAPSQVLFVAGEPAEHIYVVAEGKLAALCMSAEGHRFVSFEAGPGDVLGEAALLPAAVCRSSAEAQSHAVVFRLRDATVGALLREGGEFAEVLAVALSRRLWMAEQRARRAASEPPDSGLGGWPPA